MSPKKRSSPGSTNVLTSQAKKKKGPLSAYNIYFQLERKRILDGTDVLQLPITPDDVRTICLEQKSKEMKATRRPHRKSHGKIGFVELARTIGSRWKRLNPQSLKIIRDQVSVDRKDHVNEDHSELWTNKEMTHSHHHQDSPCSLPRLVLDATSTANEKTILATTLKPNQSDHQPHHLPVEEKMNCVIASGVGLDNNRNNHARDPVGVESPFFFCSQQKAIEIDDEIPTSDSRTTTTILFNSFVDMFAPLDPEEMEKLFDDNY